MRERTILLRQMDAQLGKGTAEAEEQSINVFAFKGK
jgi:hypothetical protein